MTEHINAQCLPEKLSKMFSRMKERMLRRRISRVPLSTVIESHSRIVLERVSITPGKEWDVEGGGKKVTFVNE